MRCTMQSTACMVVDAQKFALFDVFSGCCDHLLGPLAAAEGDGAIQPAWLVQVAMSCFFGATEALVCHLVPQRVSRPRQGSALIPEPNCWMPEPTEKVCAALVCINTVGGSALPDAQGNGLPDAQGNGLPAE